MRKLYEQIMDNPSSELFFKLINRNKSKSKTETSGLEIDGKFDFSSQNQSRAFANYYQDLNLKILQERKVPVDFKSGILTPVLKKEKNPSLVNSYRGITVTPVLSKLHEFCILGKLFINSGTDLQFGFTACLWPLFASLIISECKCEISSALSLYLATVDVQSAFDVVQHTILLDKLLDRGTHPDIWLLIKDFYSGHTSKVKMAGRIQ
ncbi:Hypothetical predicted protein [Mytilus galloprovincialis]|uniref:Reverse transcriptase domain-containing protein n=1 Tax=Mytilus galloprovincialis TaxID=29158 RepID=A0A8B6GTG1_MYTGA|nr:Hypothetical predicted protein [Mytilus galloprovincialis]